MDNSLERQAAELRRSVTRLENIALLQLLALAWLAFRAI